GHTVICFHEHRSPTRDSTGHMNTMLRGGFGIDFVAEALERSDHHRRFVQWPLPQSHRGTSSARADVLGQDLIKCDLGIDRNLRGHDNVPRVVLPTRSEPGGPPYRSSDCFRVETKHHDRFINGCLDGFDDAAVAGALW